MNIGTLNGVIQGSQLVFVSTYLSMSPRIKFDKILEILRHYCIFLHVSTIPYAQTLLSFIGTSAIYQSQDQAVQHNDSNNNENGC